MLIAQDGSAVVVEEHIGSLRALELISILVLQGLLLFFILASRLSFCTRGSFGFGRRLTLAAGLKVLLLLLDLVLGAGGLGWLSLFSSG